MYYPCSEIKGADQLGSYCEADLHLCFRMCRFKKKDCTIRVAKLKALISLAVTAKLICIFVFACADCWFSGVMAQMKGDVGKSVLECTFMV